MTVFTYHEHLPGFNDLPVLSHWISTWTNQGWTPVVLSRSDAEEYPAFDEYEETVSELPSVNPPGYDLACYLRWMAMQVQGGGLMTDYDVMNVSFTPARLIGIPPCTLRMFEQCGVPSAVAGDAEAYQAACRLFTGYCPDPLDLIGTRPHVSDQNILARHISSNACLNSRPFIDSQRLCVQYGDNGWREAPLLHFPNAATGGQKLVAIKEWSATQGR